MYANPDHLDGLQADWPAVPGVSTLSTFRSGGFSTGDYAGLNLGAHVGDDPDCVAANRQALRLQAGLPSSPLWLNQVHGIEVVSAQAGMTPDQDAVPPVADASYTRDRGIVCAVMSADCLPVLLAATDGSVVAAVHAGWRGIEAGILAATVTAAFSACRFSVQAWLGPAIGPAAFEVGDDVRTRLLDALGDAAAMAFQPGQTAGRWWADIYALARLQLAALGIDAVYGGQYCTWSDPARFFSYRRDGVTGRMATLIWRS